MAQLCDQCSIIEGECKVMLDLVNLPWTSVLPAWLLRHKGHDRHGTQACPGICETSSYRLTSTLATVS